MSEADRKRVWGLDLEPKLRRTLSPWNPLDYLRLFYWVFFFPKAILWYLEMFGTDRFGEGSKGRTIPALAEYLRQNRVELRLVWHALLATLTTAPLVAVLFQYFGFQVDWFGVAFCLAGGVAFGGGASLDRTVSVADGALLVSRIVAISVAFGVAGGLAFLVGIDTSEMTLAESSALLMARVVVLGMVFGLSRILVRGVPVGVVGNFGNIWAIGLSVGLLGGLTAAVQNGFDLATGLAVGIALGLAGGLVFCLGTLRLDAWLLWTALRGLRRSPLHTNIAKTTALPLPGLKRALCDVLVRDWPMGCHNIDQVLTYSLQFGPAIQALQLAITSTSEEDLLLRAAFLADSSLEWHALLFCSASLSAKLKSEAAGGFTLFPSPFKARLRSRWSTEPRDDTPQRAAIGGFWYLQAKMPAKAAQFFGKLRHLRHGEEMYVLAKTLALCEQGEIGGVQIPLAGDRGLRPRAWPSLEGLARAANETRRIRESVSRAARNAALNRALGELTAILRSPESISRPERALIVDIALSWRDDLLAAALEIGKVVIEQPVAMPYVIGDPVRGRHFVGREKILRDLEELWGGRGQVQSVVLYGHRRMGKTSILLNAEERFLGRLKVAHVNLQLCQSLLDVVSFVCEHVSRMVGVPPPTEESITSLPLPTLARFLSEAARKVGDGGLIVALDEFEQLERLIDSGALSPDFLGYLRGLIQEHPRIAFVFAGLHTLEEMTSDYFSPFFAGVIPLRVGFFDRETTGLVLANPEAEDFPLDYAPEALDQIHELTSGQPYLVQLIGFLLVRRFNDQVFKLGRKREAVFEAADVEAVVGGGEIFQFSRYYLTGVWGQAAKGPLGQQQALRILASHPVGLTLAEIAATAGLDPKVVSKALATLARHDVVVAAEGRWRIAVELFRRWVAAGAE